MSDVVSGRLEATPADLQQPLPAVENGRPVADRETTRETSAAARERSCEVTDITATVIQTATGHEHHVRSGTCGRGEHGRCRRRSQYDAKCVYICTCVCHQGGRP